MGKTALGIGFMFILGTGAFRVLEHTLGAYAEGAAVSLVGVGLFAASCFLSIPVRAPARAAPAPVVENSSAAA
jgi:hypothetical protein